MYLPTFIANTIMSIRWYKNHPLPRRNSCFLSLRAKDCNVTTAIYNESNVSIPIGLTRFPVNQLRDVVACTIARQ